MKSLSPEPVSFHSAKLFFDHALRWTVEIERARSSQMRRTPCLTAGPRLDSGALQHTRAERSGLNDIYEHALTP